ncbi:chlorophyll a-b binding domain-containing protein [Skeletonema marinoi]|jgi:light-harvesting complex I chlorophyll a/b binding protein 4|uniref:Chlorophyll a-b binding domain-containing protein n=1 Tax=Skeletonema marinoi TaxID=267567 RepID=A0AAD9D9N5_9STRA|nr:chlorophyll a-b binding domain-containing protein [Skeletonema marinoi]|mmetsp:Transcript_23393/g.46576  ORF Transcript_23393/g.46576 Transcript_23393/m.46576 type:complete len:203 (-) Transcript_23393:189-797(-)|eukprot:CAMPEP_0113425534 /NCGR_PEP_ID=MMETSP0013_2-20120614/30224_1 /TAXON_ID=2843 ORGANISM="Skeletonema costatum, Strain 1716" /NCGR_SAMPLE_ID=MMETSP0013_2 /ASSEMBLY_ACC=CAM_ASM_000158 /LENGTH=202 /DNA_ID=CAMNT_0000313709 /DNA_START=839 /DNA_END=1447 /DNA_ORIENTATION=- /assembly_acc=CAM_ASM_000158
MMKIATIAALIGSASAFAPAQTGKASTALNAEMSKSVPFLLNPSKTDGLIGSVGFDPINWSDNFDIKWLQESEIKHGRVAMLATAGFMAQQFVSFPMFADIHVDDSNLAPAAVGISGMMQIVFFAGAEEWRTNKGKITMADMFADSDRVPGDFGFDPMGKLKGKSEAEINDMKLKEIKNGRLAMLAIGGMIHHNFIFGEALF